MRGLGPSGLASNGSAPRLAHAMAKDYLKRRRKTVPRSRQKVGAVKRLAVAGLLAPHVLLSSYCKPTCLCGKGGSEGKSRPCVDSCGEVLKYTLGDDEDCLWHSNS